MEELVKRVQAEGVYLGGGIIKVDGFLNHQIDPALMMKIGVAFGQKFSGLNVTKVMTAESSGIAPALATGFQLGVPVIYARKKTPLTMSGRVYRSEAPSRTKGGMVPLMVSPDFLTKDDRVIIIDDFLATGLTLLAMIEIIAQAQAELVGVGCVIEKVFEPGRKRVRQRFQGELVTLVRVDLDEEQLVFVN